VDGLHPDHAFVPFSVRCGVWFVDGGLSFPFLLFCLRGCGLLLADFSVSGIEKMGIFWNCVGL